MRVVGLPRAPRHPWRAVSRTPCSVDSLPPKLLLHSPGLVRPSRDGITRPPLVGFVGLPSIDMLPGPGQYGVATEQVPGRQVRSRCRPRGFAPPRRFAVPGSRGLVASRCRPWGSPRCYPRRTSYPSKIVLAGSRTVSPRPLPSCSSADRARANADTAITGPMGLWSLDCSIDLHTTAADDHLTSRPPPLPEPFATTWRAGRFKALLHRRARALSGPDWIPARDARFFLGLVPLQGPLAPTRDAHRSRDGLEESLPEFLGAVRVAPPTRRSPEVCPVLELAIARRPSWGS